MCYPLYHEIIQEEYLNHHAKYLTDNAVQTALEEVQYEDEQQSPDSSKQEAEIIFLTDIRTA